MDLFDAALERARRKRAGSVVDRALYVPGDHGDLDVPLPDYAADLFRPHRYKVLWGGRGAGRSWSVARALLTEAHRRPMRVLCTREIQKSIRDSVHRLLSDQIEMLGLPFDVLNTEIRHPNGSLFIFEGLWRNVNKVKSIEGIDRCWVEEAETVSEESWKVLIPSIRKAGSEVWVTFNPDLETDPTYQRFVVHGDRIPNAWIRRVGWEDNPWFHETELAAEKDFDYAVDPESADHVWGGETRKHSEAQVLSGKWVVDSFEPDPEAWDGPYHGADFGFAQDPTTAGRCWVHERRLYVEYESYKIGLELDDTAERWERDVPGIGKYVVRADSARPESISYLKRHGIPQIEGVKKWSGSVEDGIAHLRQYEQIIIHPRCKHTITEARLYSYKVDKRTGDVLPKIVDAHNHCIDQLRYALAPLIRRAAEPFAFAG